MWKQVLIALVLVGALLGVYVFMTDPPPQKDPGASWSVPTIETLDRIELTVGGESAVIRLEDDVWRMAEPVVSGADADLVDRVTDLFAGDERLAINAEKEATEPNTDRHGLADETVISITLYDQGESVGTLLVGGTEDTPSGATNTWVRPEGADQIYRVNRNLRRVLDRPVTEWRNADVMVLTQDQKDALTAIEVAYTDHVLRFERVDDAWAMTSPEGIEVDPSLIARFTREVDTLRAEEFADDVTPADAGTQPAQHTVTLFFDGGEQHVVRLGGMTEPTEEGADPLRYVQVDDGSIVAVRTRTADNFAKRIHDFYRREILDLDQDAVASIQISDRDGPALLLLRNEPGDEDAESTWRMRRPERIDVLDSDAARRLLSNAAEVNARHFAPDDITVETAGLETPRRTITLVLDDESEHVVHVGAPVDPLEEGDDEDNVDRYARVDDSLIFVLRGSSVRHLLKTVDDLRPATDEEG